MRFLCSTLILLLCCFPPLLSTRGGSGEERLLPAAIHALYRGLQFMESQVTAINLDGAFGGRFVAELLNAFVESRPEIFAVLGYDLRSELKNIIEQGKRIVQVARPYLKIHRPEYYESLSGMLDESRVMMWHRSRMTNDALRVQPLPCPVGYYFNESYSDECLRKLAKSGDTQACEIEEGCIKMMTAPRQRGYMLAHQVLYFQRVEAHGCVGKLGVKKIPQALKDSLCSNVMRDAEEIADSGYPLTHQDLFFEQIAFCGLWGYKDFYRQEWLRKILEWQQESGCYAHDKEWKCEENLKEQKTRFKRDEQTLTDDCLSHKTGAAISALAANIRFLIEKIYIQHRGFQFVISKSPFGQNSMV